jgi:hypothetical protein
MAAEEPIVVWMKRPWLAVLVWVLGALALSAVAQDAPDARAVQAEQPAALRRALIAGDVLLPGGVGRQASAHGWLAMPVAGAKGPAMELLHLVARDGTARAHAGSLRVLPVSLSGPVSALAAWDGRVYVFGGAREGLQAERRSVSSVGAAEWIGPGSWRYAPFGRLAVLPSLPGQHTLLGALGTRLGPAAVVQEGAARRVLLLIDDAWRTVERPPGVGEQQELHLLADASDLLLAERAPGEARARVWRGRAVRAGETGTSSQARVVQWDERPEATVELPPGVAGRTIDATDVEQPAWLLRVDGRIVLCVAEGATLRVHRLSAGGAPVELARLSDVGPGVGVYGLSGMQRLAVVSVAEAKATAPARPGGGGPLSGGGGPVPGSIERERVRVVEVSLSTGEVLERAAGAADPLVSRRELQVLWLAMLLIGAIVLIFVVRSDAPAGVLLPPGASLATPLRRVLAGLMDTLVALALVGVAVGQSPLAMLTSGLAGASGAGGGGLGPVLGLMMAGCAHCTIAEGLAGRSVGKMLVGLRVSGMRRGKGEAGQATWVPGAPTLAQALVRNLIRWCLPPIGMMMFIDPNWRHAGDVLSRTVVVMPEEEDEPADGEGER